MQGGSSGGYSECSFEVTTKRIMNVSVDLEKIWQEDFIAYAFHGVSAKCDERRQR